MQFTSAFKNRQKTNNLISWSDWLETVAGRSFYVSAAEELWSRALVLVPSLKFLEKVPQLNRQHLEDEYVSGHILRMLAALLALQGGEDWQTVEEFVSSPGAKADLQTIVRIFKEQTATFILFCILHDAGKAQATGFTNFGQAKKVDLQRAVAAAKGNISDEVLTQYDKYYRAVAALIGEAPKAEIARDFLLTYGVECVYPEHDKLISRESSLEVYQPLFSEYRLEPRDQQLLRFLIRYHTLGAEMQGPRAALTLKTLELAAAEYGLDAADARDAWLAAVFLNDICGKIRLFNDKPTVNVAWLAAFIEAESLAFQDHRKKKIEKLAQNERQIIKSVLQEVGLSAEGLMTELDLPIGPERQKFVNGLYAAVKDYNYPIMDLFGKRTGEFVEQINMAREHFDASPGV